MELNENNYFAVLNGLNVSDHVEKKNGLSYLSWPWAWAELKKVDPKANYRVLRNELGWNYFTDNNTGWVEVGVTAFGIEHLEMLPIMDYKNAPIKKDLIDSFDVNKAIQRCLVKAIARHGIGLYIYAGEDLPEEPKKDPEPEKKTPKKGSKKAPAAPEEVPASNPAAEPEKEAPKAEMSGGSLKTEPKPAVNANPKDADVSMADGDGVLRTLPEYIKEIGAIATSIKVNEGSTENYLAVVEEVTGGREFKVKYATAADLPTVARIYNELIKAGYGAN